MAAIKYRGGNDKDRPETFFCKSVQARKFWRWLVEPHKNKTKKDKTGQATHISDPSHKPCNWSTIEILIKINLENPLKLNSLDTFLKSWWSKNCMKKINPWPLLCTAFRTIYKNGINILILSPKFRFPGDPVSRILCIF